MKRVIVSSILSWVIGIVFLMTFSYSTASKSNYTSAPVREFFEGIYFYCFYVGIITFPTCFMFAPLLRRLLPASGVKRFAFAIGFSAISGMFAMLIWELILPFLPKNREAFVLLDFTAALIGASFGLFYVIFSPKTPSA